MAQTYHRFSEKPPAGLIRVSKNLGIASLRKSKAVTRYFVKPLLPLYHLVGRTLGLARGKLVGDTYLLMNEVSGEIEPLNPEISFPDNGQFFITDEGSQSLA